MFGVELVPCIQTLAHLHNALKWPGMDKIRDSADILQPEKEETYQFIEKAAQLSKGEFFLPTGYILEWMRLSCWDLEII